MGRRRQSRGKRKRREERGESFSNKGLINPHLVQPSVPSKLGDDDDDDDDDDYTALIQSIILRDRQLRPGAVPLPSLSKLQTMELQKPC